MTITICFTRPKKPPFISKAIMWFTKSKVSHACIGGLDIAGVPILLGAGSKGVVPEIRSAVEVTDVVVEEYETELSNEAIHQVVLELNRPYDYLGVFGFGLMILAWRWFHVKIKKPLTSSRAVWCSELVAHLPLPAFAPVDPEDTTAESLRLICAKELKMREAVAQQ